MKFIYSSFQYSTKKITLDERFFFKLFLRVENESQSGFATRFRCFATRSFSRGENFQEKPPGTGGVASKVHFTTKSETYLRILPIRDFIVYSVTPEFSLSWYFSY